MLNLLLLALGAGSSGSAVIDTPTNVVVVLGRIVDLDTSNRVVGRASSTLAFSARNPVIVQIELGTIRDDGEIEPYEGATLDVVISNTPSGGAADPAAVAEIVERGSGFYVATISGSKLSDAVALQISTPFLVIHEASGLLVGVPMTRVQPKIARLTI